MKINIHDFIHSDPERMSGAPVFRGTRVPVSILFDYVRYSSLARFLEGYPHISKESAEAVLKWSKQQALAVFDWNDEES